MPPQTQGPKNPTPAPNPVPPQEPTPIPAQPPAPAPMVPAGASGHVDLTKILLPKKPGTPSVDSAQRINAGVLFEQERTAGVEGLAAGGAPQGDGPRTERFSSRKIEYPEGANPSTPEAVPPKAEQPLVRPLQTYQGDIESLVADTQVSVVSIAAAEAQRRGLQPLQQGEAPLNQRSSPWVKNALIISASVVLLALAGGIIFYIFARSQPVPLSEQVLSPFISVDDTVTIQLQPTDRRQDIMAALVAARDKVSLSLGLVARLQIAKAGSGGALAEMSAPEFLQALTPSIPASLVRTLEPQMLLGVHSYDENQAFIILRADSYETAYSGLLAWEADMYAQLTPLFTRIPAVRALSPVQAPVAATTSVATSTPAASTTPSTASTTGPAPFVPPPRRTFTDRIVENHDARVILNEQGDILFLWTFLDRSTIVIATNDATLREIISRISQTSSLPSI